MASCIGERTPWRPLSSARLVQRQLVPLRLLGAHRGGTIGLGQTVDVGEVETDSLHPLDDRKRRRGAGDQPETLCSMPLRISSGALISMLCTIGAPQKWVTLCCRDRVENRLGLHPAQAHVGAGVGRHGPRKAPAVAVKHRQRPKIHRVMRHAQRDDVARRVEVRAAMVVDHPLGVAGGAGRVVERDRIPLVAGNDQAKSGSPSSKKAS